MTDPPAAEEILPLRCARHRSVETYLRCGRCDTPICPKCLVQSLVGARCPACAPIRPLPMFVVRPIDGLRAALAGIGAATAGAMLLAILPAGGFLGLIFMGLLGFVTGEAATRAANAKRGRVMMAISALSVPTGLVIGRSALLAIGRGNDVATALTIAAVGLVIPLFTAFFVILAMAVAASRVR